MAQLQRTPVALESHECLAAGERAATRIRLHRGFDLEDGDLPAAQILAAAHAEA